MDIPAVRGPHRGRLGLRTRRARRQGTARWSCSKRSRTCSRPDSRPRATCTSRSAATRRPTAPRPRRSPTTSARARHRAVARARRGRRGRRRSAAVRSRERGDGRRRREGRRSPCSLSARGDGRPRIRAAAHHRGRAASRARSTGSTRARSPPARRAAITRMLSLFANKARGRDQTLLRTLATFPAADRADLRGDGRRAGCARPHDRRRDDAAGRHGRERAAVAGVGDPQPAYRARRDRRRDGPARAAPHPRSRSSRSTVVESSEPSPESPTDNAQFALIADAVKASYPDAATVPYVMHGGDRSRHFHRFSPAVYRFAPLEMSNAQRASIHGVDERVEIASLETRRAVPSGAAAAATVIAPEPRV